LVLPQLDSVGELTVKQRSMKKRATSKAHLQGEMVFPVKREGESVEKFHEGKKKE
jgi:hypothetical protein